MSTTADNGRSNKLPVLGAEGGGASGNGRRQGDATPPVSTLGAVDDDLPSSRKVYLTEGQLQVPVREIAVSAGNPPVRVYDTTGPQGHDVRVGLPKLRKP